MYDQHPLYLGVDPEQCLETLGGGQVYAGPSRRSCSLWGG